MPAKKVDFSFQVSFKEPAAGSLKTLSMRIDLFKNAQTKIAPNYVQNIEREIQFLWQFCPLSSELEFVDLVLHYLFSDSRYSAPGKYPFSKLVIETAQRIYPIDRFRFNMEIEKTRFGQVDCLLVNQSFGVYRLRIASGFRIPPHYHNIMEEKEIILTDGLSLDDKSIAGGTVKVWPKKIAHSYENNTLEEQSILCIDKPPFDPSDEVLV